MTALRRVLRSIGDPTSANDACDSTNTTANADGSLFERAEALKDQISAITGGTTAPTGAGTPFVLSATVVSSTIPNNTQTSAAITSAASGALLIESITLETNSTGVAGPTNVEISTDNSLGLTGAGAPNALAAVSGLGANKTVNIRDAANEVVPFVLESGKKIFVHGDDAAGTGAGTVRITIAGRRITAGASIAVGGIGT